MSIAVDTEIVRKHLEKIVPGNDLSHQERDNYRERIKTLLKKRNAVLVAHYYTDPEVQRLAEESGGCVSDSLEMARFGHDSDADVIIVAGVKFMGETAKILTPEKKVYMPTLEATCSLDLGCPIDEFSAFCDKHPERTVVVYANTSAAVKARADWVVTSSIALDVVDYLDQQGEKILWAPDQHLGRYIQNETRADILLWDGACIVHEEFKAKGLRELKNVYPEAAVLVHPESPTAVIELADAVGSTTQIINAARNMANKTFIVATDQGIFYQMQKLCPDKTFIASPTAGDSATCRSCASCPWMGMNTMRGLADLLENLPETCEVIVDPALIPKALEPLHKMLDFAKKNL